MSDDGKEEEEEVPDFEVLTQNDVTGRMQDIFKILDDKSKTPSVFNIDAMLPQGDRGFELLRSILWKMQKSVEVFSLKFNTLSPEAEDYFIEWLAKNETLKTLYIMGSNLGMDEKKKNSVYNAWTKNMDIHKHENNGCTLMRRDMDPEAEEDEG